MPLRLNITMDEVVRLICQECCRPPITPANTDNAAIVSVSNAGYFILHKMGFVHEEIRQMMEEAHKVRYVEHYRQTERKRRRDEPKTS